MSNPVIDKFETKGWYNDQGEYHREDGPAVEYGDGTKHWFREGKRHREDGPACDYANGDKEWWYHGEQIDCQDEETFTRLIKLKAFW